MTGLTRSAFLGFGRAVLSYFLRFPFLRFPAQKWKTETIKYHWRYEMSIARERAPGIKNRVVMLQKTGLSHQPGQLGLQGSTKHEESRGN
jgi:hypothetical protein